MAADPKDQKKVTRADLEAKLSEINTELSDTEELLRPKATAVAIAGFVLLLIIVFLLGRRKGERVSTIVEVRRL